MTKNIRINEYKVFIYRLLLVYLAYTLCRLLFVFFNHEILHVDSIKQLISLCYYGLRFDTVIILYLNSLFIFLSLIPSKAITTKQYQKVLFYIYFIPNAVGLALNFIDFIYYRFTNTRSNVNIGESISNESNKFKLLSGFLFNYWYVFLLFFVMLFAWIYLYKVFKISKNYYKNQFKYYAYSIIILFVITILFSFGIRGDFDITTRPINIVDASSNVHNIAHSDVVLNTPFCVFRNFSNSNFKKVNFVSEKEINNLIKPIKSYNKNEGKKLNVVVFIMESFGREYLGSFNKNKKIKNYVSYTPFLDSLSNNSMIYTNAYTNGLKSIHAMPAILAGIPSFKEAFTSSIYVNTKIESLVSTLNSDGYETSFFHGAPNGSMGFLGFSHILEYQHYYGMTEYNNENDFDGTWGIWDEKFFNFMEKTITKQKKPFFATVFSLSSHDPFQVPEEYKDDFKEGDVPLHKCIKYADFALKKFFENAAKEEWFNNTLFVITGDHCNQIFYDEYNKTLNRTAIPILFFMPGDKNFKGVDNDWAQHIDIYPTVLDILGYKKPFRSWGRSLLNKNEVKPFAINYINNQYQFMYGNYICTFDGEKVTGYYHKSDGNYTKNLIGQNHSDFKEIKKTCESFVQNYYEKIIDRNLDSH